MVEKISSAAGQYIIFSTSYGRTIGWNGTSTPTSGQTMIPVLKGDTITVIYTLGGTTQFFRFIYTEGQNS